MKIVRTGPRASGKSKLEQPSAVLVIFFLAKEYSLDYCIHTYPKPIITWGGRDCMGGGLRPVRCI